MDFDIRFNIQINKTEDEKDDAYEILEILELIRDGRVSFNSYGDETVLIDNTRGNVSIGKVTNVILTWNINYLNILVLLLW